MRLGSDQGAIGVPWMVKLAIALAVFGVLGYDTFVTIATHLSAENDAQNAAYAASSAWSSASSDGVPQNADTAFQGAITYLAGKQSAKCMSELKANSTLASPSSIPTGCDYICTGAKSQAGVCGSHGRFAIDPDGTVHLVLRKQAQTLVFSHLGFMHSLLVAWEHGDASVDTG
ncbi:MAG TPA: hypothetical protein VHC43_16410 [Mycobacteriales bacterium]|nr:hypothetical protein [Mycobacteriales bacterium]